MALTKTAAPKPTQLTTVKPALPAKPQELPEHLRGMQGTASGFEEADRDDFVLPRLSICQSLTPQKKKTDPKYIVGLEDGDLFDTVTGQIYAKAGEELAVIPLFLTKQRIKFKGKIGEGIDCQSPNGKTEGRYSPQSCRACKFSQWGSGKDGQGQACTELKNLVVLIQGQSSPIMFSNKSTMIKVAKDWMSQMKMLNLPMFARVYFLKTLETTQNGNTFSTYQVRPGDYVPQEAFEICRNFFESLHDKNIAFDPADFEQGDTGMPDEEAAY